MAGGADGVAMLPDGKHCVTAATDGSVWLVEVATLKQVRRLDGSHKGGEFVPTNYSADESKTVYFCGCKQSKNGALCDGTHKAL